MSNEFKDMPSPRVAYSLQAYEEESEESIGEVFGYSIESVLEQQHKLEHQVTEWEERDNKYERGE